jgi:hypothetical protein
MMILSALVAAMASDYTSLIAVPSADLALTPESAETVGMIAGSGPAVVVADKPGFSYTYVELNYTWFDSDAAGSSLDGVELIGSLELPLNLFVQLTGSSYSGDLDLIEYRLGAGWHFSLGETVDLYGILFWVDQNYSGGFSDQNGAAADVGVRFAVTPKIELGGYGEWADIDNSNVGLGLTGRYYFGGALSLGARVLFIDSGDQWAAGLRFQF